MCETPYQELSLLTFLRISEVVDFSVFVNNCSDTFLSTMPLKDLLFITSFFVDFSGFTRWVGRLSVHKLWMIHTKSSTPGTVAVWGLAELFIILQKEVPRMVSI